MSFFQEGLLKGSVLLIIFLFSWTSFAQVKGGSALTSEQKKIVKEAATSKNQKRLLEIFQNHGKVDPILKSLCRNPKLPASLVEILVKKASTEAPDYMDKIGRFESYRLALAQNTGLTNKQYRLLAQIPFARNTFYPFMHKKLAGNPSTPYPILLEFMQFYDFAPELAPNSTLTAKNIKSLFDSLETLKKIVPNRRLRGSGVLTIRGFLNNPKTPTSVLKQIEKDINSKDAWWITLQQGQPGFDMKNLLKELKSLVLKHKNYKKKIK